MRPARVLPALLVTFVACSSEKSSAPPPPAPVATVTLTGLPDSANVGETFTLGATLRDASGNTLTGRTVSWSSSDTLSGAVSTSGVLTVTGHGAFTVTATSEGKSATANGRGILTRAANRFAYAVVTGGTTSATTTQVANATGGTVRAALGSNAVIVTLERLARVDTSWRETVMVTRTGSLATHCHLNGWGPAANRRDLEVSVSCFATDGTWMPGVFSILVFGNGTLEGRHGFVESTDATATHTPAAAKWFNTSGQAMSVTRLAAGSYRVAVNNARPTGKVENYFVTTIGAYGTSCILNGWSFGNTSDIVCNRADLTQGDARFTKQLIEGGRAGRRWALGWNDTPTRVLDSEGSMSSNYAMSSNGQPVHVVRTTSGTVSSGIYDVRFPGMGALAALPHNIQVSPYLSGRANCSPSTAGTANGGADLQVRVSCFDRYSGAPTNTYFTILLIE